LAWLPPIEKENQQTEQKSTQPQKRNTAGETKHSRRNKTQPAKQNTTKETNHNPKNKKATSARYGVLV
jgi:hypothetical protein